jgi:hypothetical protein
MYPIVFVLIAVIPFATSASDTPVTVVQSMTASMARVRKSKKKDAVNSCPPITSHIFTAPSQ